MMKTISVLTVNGSPHDGQSNTRGFVDDFLDNLSDRGVSLERRTISLGAMNLKPCQGCWVCTKGKPCVIQDDLGEIKEAMLHCDMLILASPVYTNQVTAQMKSLFDRLFTWCHVFPLLGKYGMTALTTGNDGYRETGEFLEKILATYGISSFGTLIGKGAYTPGFFPRRRSEGMKNDKLAARVADAFLSGKPAPVTGWNNKMFRVMKRKLMGVNIVRHLSHFQLPGSPAPSKSLMRMIQKGMNKNGIDQSQVEKLAKLMEFEYSWWLDRSWMSARSFRSLAAVPVPDTFDLTKRLLHR